MYWELPVACQSAADIVRQTQAHVNLSTWHTAGLHFSFRRYISDTCKRKSPPSLDAPHGGCCPWSCQGLRGRLWGLPTPPVPAAGRHCRAAAARGRLARGPHWQLAREPPPPPPPAGRINGWRSAGRRGAAAPQLSGGQVTIGLTQRDVDLRGTGCGCPGDPTNDAGCGRARPATPCEGRLSVTAMMRFKWFACEIYRGTSFNRTLGAFANWGV